MATVTSSKRQQTHTSGTYESNGDVTIGGNLNINGTTTTIDTANLLVEDKNIIIGDVTSPTDVTADGGGITLKGATDKTITWVNSTNAWTSNQMFAATNLSLTSLSNYSSEATALVIQNNNVGTRELGTAAFSATSAFAPAAGSTGIVSLGTVVQGSWNAGVISSTYLDADTAHLSGAQAFTGTKTFDNLAIGSSNKIKFANNDYIRYDDTANRFHFDADAGTSNASVQAATFAGALSGNASTATKWATARTLSLTGEVTGSVSWDGSGNASLATTMNNNSLDDQYVTVGSRYAGNASALSAANKASIRGWDVSTGTDDPSGSSDGLVLTAGWDSSDWAVQQFHDFHSNDLYLRSKQSGTWMTTWDKVFHDTYHPNADTLTTARTIALSGAVTGSASFNGGSNITIATTNTADPTLTLAGDATGAATFTNLGNATLTVAVTNDSHTHDGRYYTETETNGFLNLKANLSGPTFTGTPTAPTPTLSDNSTKLATTEYVKSQGYITSANGGNAGTLDGYDSTQFLRSDANDTMSGTLTFSGASSHIALQQDHVVFKRFDVTVDEGVTASTTAYLLLCRNAPYNDVNGTVTMDRTSGLRHACSVDIVVSAGTGTNPAGTCRSIGTAGGSSPSYELVTLTYSSNSFIALKITNPDAYYETSGHYFTGRLATSDTANAMQMIAPASVSSVSGFSSNPSHQIDGYSIFHDGYHPNADVLTTSRYISLGGDLSGSAQFNGGSDITITAAVANDSHTHTKLSGFSYQTEYDLIRAGNNNGLYMKARWDPSTTNRYWDMGYVDGNGTFSSGLKVFNNGNLTYKGNTVFHDTYHPNADILTTARTIALSGAVTGSASFNGGSNITIATTNTADPTLTLAGDATGSATFTNLGNATLTVAVTNDSHTHDGRYYTETESDTRFLRSNAADILTGVLTVNEGSGGNIVYDLDNNGVYIPKPIGADYATGTNAHTGAIAIKLPTTSWNVSDMIGFYVDIFDYNGGTAGESISLHIFGYPYSTGLWANVGALTTSDRSDRDYTVRFGHDGTRHIVYIGETNSPWNYLQVNVRDFHAGFSAIHGNWDSGWDVVPNTTSFSNVQMTSSNNYPYAKSLIGLTSTVAELNYSDGVTSNIQTQLNGKQASGSYYPSSNPNGYTNDQTATEIKALLVNGLTATHLMAGSVGASEIGNDVVNSQHYAAGSIDNEHIADNAINSEHYADGSIDNAHIADNAINSEHYADNSIDALHLNVSGNGTTSQYLRSDGDGTMSWVTPPDTNTVYTLPSNVVIDSSNYSVSNRIRFRANETNNWDTIATTTSNQGCIEIFNTGSGNDAFMSFHAGADYAGYFGLDADTNDLAWGGWSVGAVKHRMFHAGNSAQYTSSLNTKLGGIATSANNYSLPAGSSSTRGGFKIGYSESGKNYPVELSSEKMYVNVPWSDTNTNTTYSAGTHLALSGTTFNLNLGATDKVLNIGHNATTNNEGEIILDTSNAGSPQIGFTEHGDASWAIGIDDGDNSFKIHGNANTTIPTINNLTTPKFEVTTGTAGYLSGNRIFADNYHPNADILTTSRYISLGGDLSGSAQFNGGSDITITAALTANSVAAAEIAASAVGASELNVSGNGTTAQFLRSDADGTFTWATPTDTNTNTTYSGGTGITLSGTTFNLTDTAAKLSLSGGTMTGTLEIKKAQSTAAFTNPFLKLQPTSTTNGTGVTTIYMSTTTATSAYGVSLNAWRNPTDNQAFTIKQHIGTAAGYDRLTILKNGYVGIGTTTPSSKLQVNGTITGTTKNFLIDNPKTGGELQYSVIESNEHGVSVRGESDQEEIQLPDEWEWLVHEDSVTVHLTSIDQVQHLFVLERNNIRVRVGGIATNGQYSYVISGTRKDVDPLEVHI